MNDKCQRWATRAHGGVLPMVDRPQRDFRTSRSGIDNSKPGNTRAKPRSAVARHENDNIEPGSKSHVNVTRNGKDETGSRVAGGQPGGDTSRCDSERCRLNGSQRRLSRVNLLNGPQIHGGARTYERSVSFQTITPISIMRSRSKCR